MAFTRRPDERGRLPIEPGAFYIMDRGYIDFRRLRRIAEAGAFFVIRDRPDVRYYVAASRRVDRTTNLRSDQSIRLNGTDAPKHWPGLLRRVSLYDFEHSCGDPPKSGPLVMLVRGPQKGVDHGDLTQGAK